MPSPTSRNNEPKPTVLQYVKIKFENNLCRRALIDTGACSNVINKKIFEEISQKSPEPIEFEKPKWDLVKMASGQLVKVEKQAKITFQLAHRKFTESFLVLTSTNPVILGNPFFIKHDITISPKRGTIQFPDLTVQINEIKPVDEKRRTFRHKKISIYTNKKQTIQPYQQTILECSLHKDAQNCENQSGVVIPNEILEKATEIALTSYLSTIDKNNVLFISALKITEHPITINGQTKFSILSTEQAEKLTQIDPQLMALAKSRNKEDIFGELNQLIQADSNPNSAQNSRPELEYNKLWFPTPETCDDPSNLPQLQQEIYEQILKFQQLDRIDPKNK